MTDVPRDRPPTAHLMRAALHVASILGHRSSAYDAVRESYWRHATGGAYPPSDLEAGEGLLIQSGLVIEHAGMLQPTRALQDLLAGTPEDAIAAIAMRWASLSVDGPVSNAIADPEAWSVVVDDPMRRQDLLVALGKLWDAAHRRELGAIGEEVVLARARGELIELGYPDLALGVRRVSLESDALGYDISAPRTEGPARLLEVKSTTSSGGPTVRFYVSRNEYDTGHRYPDSWALVVCIVTDVAERQGTTLGWCDVSQLSALVPIDTAGGRWESAELQMPIADLEPDLPRATP